jgi:hypothetical protein
MTPYKRIVKNKDSPALTLLGTAFMLKKGITNTKDVILTKISKKYSKSE